MTIDEVYYSGDISTRTRNVCGQNGLNDLSSILKYYQENETFLKLRNCGRKSNMELTSLCLKYLAFELDLNEKTIKIKTDLSDSINNFTRLQRDIVNKFIEINKFYLSNRSRNSINTFLNGNFKIQNISEQILLNNKFDFEKIRHAGKKSIDELKVFFNSIIDFIETVAELKNEYDLIKLSNQIFIKQTFSNLIIPENILESLSIFKLVDYLIANDAIFKKHEKTIFVKTIKVYNNQPNLTLEEVSKEINLTKERVRQIRKRIKEKLFNRLQFIRNIEHDLTQRYSIGRNQNLIVIDDDLNNEINRINETYFSKEFNSIIIFISLSDKIDLIGDIEDILFTNNIKSRGVHNWNNFYLINRNISNCFNFFNFVNDLNSRIYSRIEENYNFYFSSYLFNFLTSTNLDDINEVSEIAEKVLNIEFEIYLDTEDKIEFKGNSLKQAYEYAYEALQSIGRPSKVDQIFKKIKELNPDYETDTSRVRSSMKRFYGFVPIGRSSTFGLKEWENQMENFKGGTIRSIVYEYLDSEINPQHISDIAKYVLKYRPNTYERSILDNIKADETKTFIFFKNSTIGLNSKKYNKSFIRLNQGYSPELKNWEERFNDFIQFTKINNRLPFSSGCPDEEIKLDRWYRAQKWRIKNGKLDKEKCILLNEVTINLKQNDTSRRSRSNIIEKYNELKQFVILKKRLPSGHKSGEGNLYQFYNKKRKLYEKGELDKVEEINFLEIAKHIQTYYYENKRN